ncbi:azurin [Shewanella oneidensis MR-1]|uniref:Azurin n=1 Tax=Shewanella oneidensis (strain ATCC 700550 / JCM 31522 / CIP 106686 / LMG 19005 / NCIMB 14063 / MR-1) TaxID=211586 RepID=Q8CVD5_SHEON|nr:azurin [Shewanella oneidensis]AAN53885.1 periplasmic azurin Azu [Shewanella oneidensis MR-1]MDX5997288.1 azurin [Shewanella oneidensis]MEE2029058.1 Azurin [Shewanella oneidensis]QKG95671.1 azurin [Shewanella oneidensis MR-1]
MKATSTIFRNMTSATLLGLGLFVASQASANECELKIAATDAMQFDTKELSVPATCKEVTLTLTHTGTLPKAAMGHNWVLTKAADMSAVATDGMGAGADAAYVKAGDSRVIAHTGLVGGGESTSVTFSTAGMSPTEAYQFFCSFPGHRAIMQGSFKLKG